jgi:hypothetical protein
VEIQVKIVETIKQDYVSYTYKCKLVHNMLVKLKDWIALTDKIQERELIKKYQTACKLPKSQNID